MSVETNPHNYTNMNNTFSQIFLPARISPKETDGASGGFLPTPSMRESTGFLLPRLQGADEARRLVLVRIVLEKSSDFVQETQPSFRNLHPTVE